MASSRLEKVGTIYSRVKGLLKSGALKEENKPIWYEVYEAFPPKYEPRYDRPAPDTPIRNIFYPEDIIRAKFHKQNKSLPAVNLSDERTQTLTQKFIIVYNKLKEEGKTPEENMYATAVDLLNNEQKFSEIEKQDKLKDGVDSTKSSLASSFEEAQREKKLEANINIKDIFKE